MGHDVKSDGGSNQLQQPENLALALSSPSASLGTALLPQEVCQLHRETT